MRSDTSRCLFVIISFEFFCDCQKCCILPSIKKTQTMTDTTDFVPHHKVVLLGNSGCGKTSIICRYVSNSFTRETKSTVGGNHQKKRVQLDDGPVDLFIWDTAGQERFQALMPLYARSSDLGIITVSVTDKSSFDSVDQWIELVGNACSPVPPLVLAVNKMDDFEHASYTVDEINNMYKDKFKGIFFVSALSGENIEQLFEFVALEAVNFAKEITPPPEQPAETQGKKKCC